MFTNIYFVYNKHVKISPGQKLWDLFSERLTIASANISGAITAHRSGVSTQTEKCDLHRDSRSGAPCMFCALLVFVRLMRSSRCVFIFPFNFGGWPKRRAAATTMTCVYSNNNNIRVLRTRRTDDEKTSSPRPFAGCEPAAGKAIRLMAETTRTRNATGSGANAVVNGVRRRNETFRVGGLCADGVGPVAVASCRRGGGGGRAMASHAGGNRTPDRRYLVEVAAAAAERRDRWKPAAVATTDRRWAPTYGVERDEI